MSDFSRNYKITQDKERLFRCKSLKAFKKKSLPLHKSRKMIHKKFIYKIAEKFCFPRNLFPLWNDYCLMYAVVSFVHLEDLKLTNTKWFLKWVFKNSVH